MSVVGFGYGRPKGVTIHGGTVAAFGYGKISQSFISLLRMRTKTQLRDRPATSTVEGRGL